MTMTLAELTEGLEEEVTLFEEDFKDITSEEEQQELLESIEQWLKQANENLSSQVLKQVSPFLNRMTKLKTRLERKLRKSRKSITSRVALGEVIQQPFLENENLEQSETETEEPTQTPPTAEKPTEPHISESQAESESQEDKTRKLRRV